MVETEGWHLRKEITLGVIIILLGSIITFSTRMSMTESKAESNSKEIVELKTLNKETEKKISGIYESVIRIETILSMANIEIPTSIKSEDFKAMFKN